jgi:hypothetical protein
VWLCPVPAGDPRLPFLELGMDVLLRNKAVDTGLSK